MKRVWIPSLLLLLGLTPVHDKHESPDKTDVEFKNLFDNAQGKDFVVMESTPAVSDLIDGQIIIFSSSAVKIMFRQNNEIYAVSMSCITVRR